MDNTFDKKVPPTPKDGSSKTLPAGRFAEQTEATNGDSAMAEVQSNGRLKQVTAVGRKPETFMVAPDEIEDLRPSEEEMKNG